MRESYCQQRYEHEIRLTVATVAKCRKWSRKEIYYYIREERRVTHCHELCHTDDNVINFTECTAHVDLCIMSIH